MSVANKINYHLARRRRRLCISGGGGLAACPPQHTRNGRPAKGGLPSPKLQPALHVHAALPPLSCSPPHQHSPQHTPKPRETSYLVGLFPASATCSFSAQAACTFGFARSAGCRRQHLVEHWLIDPGACIPFLLRRGRGALLLLLRMSQVLILLKSERLCFNADKNKILNKQHSTYPVCPSCACALGLSFWMS